MWKTIKIVASSGQQWPKIVENLLSVMATSKTPPLAKKHFFLLQKEQLFSFSAIGLRQVWRASQ